jgi:hypothetical protein
MTSTPAVPKKFMDPIRIDRGCPKQSNGSALSSSHAIRLITYENYSAWLQQIAMARVKSPSRMPSPFPWASWAAELVLLQKPGS